MKILNFGSCNIDYVYSLEHIVVPGETLAARKREVFPGGKGLNQSGAAARAGAKVWHAGVIGRDGQLLRTVLAGSGADTRYLKEDDSPNGHAVIQVAANAQNSIFLFEGTNGMVTRQLIEEVLADFGPGDILLLQNEISNVPYLIRRGFEKGMMVVFNPAPFAESLKKLDLSRIHTMILNEVEAAGFFGTEDLDAILHRAADLQVRLVITLGKQGCVYVGGSQVLRCPAFRVEAVDTTAAGDTFTGYYVAGMARGLETGKLLRTCCAASALAVSAMGAAPSIPTADRVEAALNTLQPAREIPGVEAAVMAYCAAHLTDGSLAGLAESLGYSQGYTASLVKKHMGQTFGQLLQQQRCREAARLLRETDLPVESVIQAVGYRNQSFFRRAFAGLYGRTPLQFRKNILGGTEHDQ